jgi:hypothetical protein
MPKNYALDQTPANAQRRPAQAQDDDWIRAFLARAEVGHIATHWDDQPFITPSTFWHDAEQHRLIFHSNIVGRVRANADRHPQVCFEASAYGRLLPSNVALEFSIQYESVIVFGTIAALTDLDEKRAALNGLLRKYFPQMAPGREYRPITDIELKQTSVYAIAIQQWSGKRNWPEAAEQSDAWPPLRI